MVEVLAQPSPYTRLTCILLHMYKSGLPCKVVRPQKAQIFGFFIFIVSVRPTAVLGIYHVLNKCLLAKLKVEAKNQI